MPGKPVIFVDGSEGTTGLEINERLAERSDLEVRSIAPELRKDPEARRELICGADIVFLCLPDAASKEAVLLAGEHPRPRFLDASTAHRTAPGWVYGLPELGGGRQREVLRQARRVAVPGCHASGFNLIVAPLVAAGVIPSDYPLSCTSITGFSGGGKKLIASYAAEAASTELRQAKASTSDERVAPRPYALGLTHKHLPEMKLVSGLDHVPHFMPVIGDFYRGMAVCVPLQARLMKTPLAARDIAAFLAKSYAGERFVQVAPFNDAAQLDDGFFRTLSSNGTNRCDLTVFGHEEQTLLIARLDNLGKGASGAAIQCMNIMLGVDEGRGLVS